MVALRLAMSRDSTKKTFPVTATLPESGVRSRMGVGVFTATFRPMSTSPPPFFCSVSLGKEALIATRSKP